MGRAGLIVLAVVAGIILIFALVGFGGYNTLVTKRQNVDAQWALVQTQMQRRADLIPNIVATVKGVAGPGEKGFSRIGGGGAQPLSTPQKPNRNTEPKNRAGHKMTAGKTSRG